MTDETTDQGDRIDLISTLRAENDSLKQENERLKEKLPILYKGDKIKLYGKETKVEGFSVGYNDAYGIEDYEIIIHTTGRADPFKRSLDVIEIFSQHDKQS